MLTCREGHHFARPLLAIALGSSTRAGTFEARQTRPQRPKFASRSLVTHTLPAPGTGSILTLAYKIKSLAPRILPAAGSGAAFTETSEFWEDVLTHACDNYTSSSQRPACVVVYGTDSWSLSEDLVTALLSEPLASDDSVNELLRTRHQDRSKEKPLHISYAKVMAVNADSIQIPSTYLQRFSYPVQLIEMQSEGSSQRLDEERSLILFKADFPFIVVNPVTTSLASLLRLRLPSNTILTLISPVSASSDHPHPALTPASPRSQAIISVDPSRAIKALTALQADSTSPLAVQRYQDDFVSSGVPVITQNLRQALGLSPESALTSLRANIALTHLRDALSTCQDFLSSAKGDITAVLTDISSLRTRAAEAQRRAQADVFGLPQTKLVGWGSIWPPILRSKHDQLGAIEGKPSQEPNGIVNDLSQSQRHMRSIMDNLTWWRVLWRIDEITILTRIAIEQIWCRELEKKLVMQAGRLAYLQQDFTAQAFSMLGKYQAKPPFNSALIHNALQQECTSPSYKLTTSSLIEPLHKRKLQLIEYPTTQLHLGGQRALVGMSAGITTSATFSWAGWFGWLSGAGLSSGTDNALLQALSSTTNIGFEPMAAVGLGALGALASIRWAIGKWERSKKRWWEDWERLNQGLQRDLEVTLEKVMKEKVTVISESGCAALHKLADKRKKEVEGLDKEWQILLSELEDLQKQMGG